MKSEPRACACPRARHKHGTLSAYNADRCRCEPCARAHYLHIKQWRMRRDRLAAKGHPVGLIDGHGTVLRMRALARIGWSTSRLADKLGVTQARVSELQHHQGRVRATLAARVADLYDQLWNAWPDTAGANRTRNEAARKGWLPPMALDDDELDTPGYVPAPLRSGGPWDLQPCGTPAAARRHRRRGEQLDAACRNAELQGRRERARLRGQQAQGVAA